MRHEVLREQSQKNNITENQLKSDFYRLSNKYNLNSTKDFLLLIKEFEDVGDQQRRRQELYGEANHAFAPGLMTSDYRDKPREIQQSYQQYGVNQTAPRVQFGAQ